MSGQPFLKFFPTDWRADPAVRICSLAARGLWFEMLCLMHEGRGFLRIGDKPMTPLQLARLVGSGSEDIAPLLAELDENGVFSRDEADGAIYCRRMLRDIKRAEMADPTAAERVRRYRARQRNGGGPEGTGTQGKKGGITGNRNDKSVTSVTSVTPMARARSQTFSIEKEESLTTARNGAADGCAPSGAASPSEDDDQKEKEIKLLLGRVETEFPAPQRLRIIAKLEHVENRAAYLLRCLAKPYPQTAKVVPIKPKDAEHARLVEEIRSQRRAAP